MIGLLAIDPSQPKVIKTFVWGERCGFLAIGNAGVPGAQFEIGAAEQVVGFGGRIGADLLLKKCDRFINLA